MQQQTLQLHLPLQDVLPVPYYMMGVINMEGRTAIPMLLYALIVLPIFADTISFSFCENKHRILLLEPRREMLRRDRCFLLHNESIPDTFDGYDL